MTGTEERILAELQKVGGANSLALSKTLGLSLELTRFLCKKLLNAGYLQIVYKENSRKYTVIRWDKEPDYQKMRREYPGDDPSRKHEKKRTSLNDELDFYVRYLNERSKRK